MHREHGNNRTHWWAASRPHTPQTGQVRVSQRSSAGGHSVPSRSEHCIHESAGLQLHPPPDAQLHLYPDQGAGTPPEPSCPDQSLLSQKKVKLKLHLIFKLRTNLKQLVEASLKRRSGQLTDHCCASSPKLIICTCF